MVHCLGWGPRGIVRRNLEGEGSSQQVNAPVMLLHDLSVQDGTLYGSALALGGSPCQLLVWEYSWQCSPTQGFLPQGCLPVLADIALDAIMLLSGCSFSDQESQLCDVTPELQSSLSPGICVAVLLQQLFGGAGENWEMQGHIPMALVAKHGARCKLPSLPQESVIKREEQSIWKIIIS